MTTEAMQEQPTPGEDARLALIYEESVRMLASQERKLDELRARTGVVLAASTVSASFLGAATLARGSFTAPSALAVVAFVAGVVYALQVLWPTGDWNFTQSPKKLIDVYVDAQHGEDPEDPNDIDYIHRNLALEKGDYWTENEKILGPQQHAFSLACLLLGVQIVLWILDLATRS